MDEAQIIAATPAPRTRESLAADLRAAGMQTGMTVLVHASLSALGWVAGGPVTVIQALFDAVGPTGNAGHAGTFGPTHRSGQMAGAAGAGQLGSSRSGRMLPAYDPQTTPTRGMGAIAELFRTWPGTCAQRASQLFVCGQWPGGGRYPRRSPARKPAGSTFAAGPALRARRNHPAAGRGLRQLHHAASGGNARLARSAGRNGWRAHPGRRRAPVGQLSWSRRPATWTISSLWEQNLSRNGRAAKDQDRIGGNAIIAARDLVDDAPSSAGATCHRKAESRKPATARARYPSRDNPSSSRADNWAGRPGRYCAGRGRTAGRAPAAGPCRCRAACGCPS